MNIACIQMIYFLCLLIPFFSIEKCHPLKTNKNTEIMDGSDTLHKCDWFLFFILLYFHLDCFIVICDCMFLVAKPNYFQRNKIFSKNKNYALYFKTEYYKLLFIFVYNLLFFNFCTLILFVLTRYIITSQFISKV